MTRIERGGGRTRLLRDETDADVRGDWAWDEATDGVRVRMLDGAAIPLAPGLVAEAERIMPFDGALRSPGLGIPRQLVAVGGIGKSSLPNSSVPTVRVAPGSELGVMGRLRGGGAGVRGRDWDEDETLVLSRFE